ncbi:MAG: CRTAC1 family protein, partial [Opitutus sp.]
NFCDYDRDGWLDVYVHTNLLDSVKAGGGQRDLLFHNRGDGTFENVTERAGIAGEGLTHSATWWDYNQDGWPDLYVAEDFGVADKLYRNNRDGTFTNVIHATVPQMSYSSMGADLGDVNNDGRIDFLVGDMASTSHEKDQRGMAASRELTRDDTDSPTLAPQMLRNALYLNTGTARFLEAGALAGLAATDWTWSLRLEDLDNDGRLDLHVTNGMIREYNNADMRQRIISNENPDEQMRVMKASPVLAEHNLAFRNLGDLKFEPAGAAWGLDQLGVSFGAAFADFDGDGDLDLVYANFDAAPTVLRNDSQTGHRAVFALQGTTSNRFGVGATVKLETAAGVQVRTLVIGRGYLSSSEPILHFGLGDDTKIARATVTWPSG